MSWLVLTVRPNGDFIVRDSLVRDGVIVFLAMQRVYIRPRHKRHPKLAERPAFAGYLFIRPPAPARIDGARLLTVAGEFATVPDAEIERLREREFLRDEWKPKPQRIRHQRGVMVAARHSVFGAVEGVIREQNASSVRLELANGMLLNLPDAALAPEVPAVAAE